MTEEELKKTIDTVAGIDVHSEVEAIAKEELMSYAEQLRQENKYYKKENKLWKDVTIKQAREIETKDNILTEFEKWLIDLQKYTESKQTDTISQKNRKKYILDLLNNILKELQELKEVNNEKI